MYVYTYMFVFMYMPTYLITYMYSHICIQLCKYYAYTGIASVNSPYRIAVANTPTPSRGSTSPAEAILGSVNIKKDDIKNMIDNIDNNVIDEIINNENEQIKNEKSESEIENENDDGSLEDIIARSTSSLPSSTSSYIPTSTLKENLKIEIENEIANNENIEETVKNNDDSLSQNLELLDDLNSLGMGLPINIREALRYRIRKKMSFIRLVRQLTDIHKSLQESLDPTILVVNDLLPPVENIDKGERRKKIRELVDEVRNRAPKDDLLITANKISSKWAERGLSL
jgi:hypothetical protein